MGLTYRKQKGSALTITELDNNFAYFTGSHSITGSLTVSGSIELTGSISDTVGTYQPSYKAATSLSTAQLGDLDSTPITLVEAPGVGKLIVPYQVVQEVTFGVAPFATDKPITIQYTGATNYWSNLTANVMNATLSYTQVYSGEVNIAVGETQALSNTALEMTTIGTPVIGTSETTVKITVYYHILDV